MHFNSLKMTGSGLSSFTQKQYLERKKIMCTCLLITHSILRSCVPDFIVVFLDFFMHVAFGSAFVNNG